MYVKGTKDHCCSHSDYVNAYYYSSVNSLAIYLTILLNFITTYYATQYLMYAFQLGLYYMVTILIKVVFYAYDSTIYGFFHSVKNQFYGIDAYNLPLYTYSKKVMIFIQGKERN